jgi:hypothetical protein
MENQSPKSIPRQVRVKENDMGQFKKGQEVVQVIVVAGFKSASIQTVQKVTKKGVVLENRESLLYDASTGNEIDPAIPGVYSEIIRFDGP